MNPLLAQRGMTPTAAIAFREEQRQARQEAVAKIKEQAEAGGISLSKDGYKTAAMAKLNAKAKIGSDGKPVATKFTWDPKTKTVSVS
jgi:DNA-binding protein H-NS